MDSVTEYTEQPAATDTPGATDALVAILLGAADTARAAVEEFSGDTVGEYLGATYEDPSAATHRFLARVPGYQGWQWAVVVAAYPGADHVTISEVVLVPGPTALLAPQWVPWDQRVRAGDLNPGDLLSPPADDPRLVPGYLLSGDPEVDETAAEIGLGRRQVLSLWGRDDAAQRWHEGDYGPDSTMARSTKRVCRDCGFLLPLAGSLGTMFGVCGNELAADGHVVDFVYGCGAHSDTPAPAGAGSPLFDPYDDGVLDVMQKPAAKPDPVAVVEPEEPTDAVDPYDDGVARAFSAEAGILTPEPVAVVEPEEPTDAVESVESVDQVEPVESAEPGETVESTESAEPSESAEAVESDESVGSPPPLS